MKYLRQEAGLTLIEMLAVLLLASIVGILLMNVILSSNKQHTSQVSEAANLNELSFISKEITKDFRKSTTIGIGTTDVTFSSANYKYSAGILKRNDSAYTTKLKTFCIASTETALKTADCSKISAPAPTNEKGIYIYIENANGKKVETTLFTRGGS